MEEKQENNIKIEELKEPEENKDDSKKDTKKLLLLIGIVIGCFVLFFLIRVIRSPTGEFITIDELHKKNLENKPSDINYVYNGFSFVYYDYIWYTQVQKNDTIYDIPMHFGPRDVEYIPLTGSIDKDINIKAIYVTFNPLSSDMKYVALSTAELSVNLVRGMDIIPVAACDRNKTNACKDRPIITCEDNKPTIYIKESDETAVKITNNCIIVEGKGIDLVKATDRLLLELYGVMG